jgi:hypothetical protein
VKLARYDVDPSARTHVEAAVRDFAAYAAAELSDSTRMTLQQTKNPRSFVSVIMAEDESADERHRKASRNSSLRGAAVPSRDRGGGVHQLSTPGEQRAFWGDDRVEEIMFSLARR